MAAAVGDVKISLSVEIHAVHLITGCLQHLVSVRASHPVLDHRAGVFITIFPVADEKIAVLINNRVERPAKILRIRSGWGDGKPGINRDGATASSLAALVSDIKIMLLIDI